MAALPDGAGYWVANAAGHVTAHGAAVAYGSLDGLALNAPIAHIVATADGHGYWLVAADGGIFAFGDAPFLGSMGAVPSRCARSSTWHPPPTATATGWWPPTVASSPSATPASTARWAVSPSTSRWWA